jgi:hypothetical protein
VSSQSCYESSAHAPPWDHTPPPPVAINQLYHLPASSRIINLAVRRLLILVSGPCGRTPCVSWDITRTCQQLIIDRSTYVCTAVRPRCLVSPCITTLGSCVCMFVCVCVFVFQSLSCRDPSGISKVSDRQSIYRQNGQYTSGSQLFALLKCSGPEPPTHGTLSYLSSPTHKTHTPHAENYSEL